MKLFWLSLLAAVLPAAGPQWKLQFFHDKDDSRLTLNDLRFPSGKRGIACGWLEEKGRVKPTVVVTSDGGENWSYVDTRELGLSLFFLSDSLGWMVGSCGGIWHTEESGRSWTRIGSLKGVLRVYFLDEQRGFAVGSQKSLWRTSNGGADWERVKIPGEPDSDPAHSTYTWITFVGSKDGMVVGASTPPRARSGRFPDWMDPSAAQKRRQWPGLSLVLETRDGGTSWRAAASSVFGQITRVRLSRDYRGLALVEFRDAFEWPSEVHRMDTRTGKSERTFRRQDRAVTDVLLCDQGPGYLAAIEPPGTVRSLPIPGKLKILKSMDLVKWEEMEVDYRAEGRRAVLASADSGDVWVATDFGMILKLAGR